MGRIRIRQVKITGSDRILTTGIGIFPISYLAPDHSVKSSINPPNQQSVRAVDQANSSAEESETFCLSQVYLSMFIVKTSY